MLLRNQVLGDFGHRRAPSRNAKGALSACAAALFLALVGAQCITQWLAGRLQYQQQLGGPWLDLRPSGPPLYAPWQGYVWKGRLEKTDTGVALAETAGAAYQTALLLSAAVAALIVSTVRRHAANRAGELHGSAGWAKRKDIEHAGLLAKEGVIIGAWRDPQTQVSVPLRHNGPDHILFFATTGAGKGVGCVVPTLLTWNASALVLDIKGENFALTSGYRRSLGHNVFKLDFGAAPEQTAHFNPLDFIRFGTLQEEADVQRICSARIDPSGALRQSHSDGHHWLTTGIGFLAAALLHSVYSRARARGWRNGPCPVGLSDIAADLSNPAKSAKEMLEEWLTYPHDPRLGQNWRDHEGNPTATHPIVSAVARIQLGRSQNERSAILSTVTAALEIFRDPLLAVNTGDSDFSLDDLMDAEQPTTIYFVVRPSDLVRLTPVIRLFLDLLIRRLTEQMSFAGGQEVGTHKHELLLLLDELPALGKVSVIAETLGYFRGWNIKALIIVQSLMQLREHYGQYESITGLCSVSAAYAPAKVDIETAKHLSAMCGQMTAIRRSPRPWLSASSGDAYTEQEVARPLYTPDEVSTLPGPRREGRRIVEPAHMLVFSSGCPAIYGEQFLFFQNRVLRARSALEAAPPVPPERIALRVSKAAYATAPAAHAGCPALPPTTAPANATDGNNVDVDDDEYADPEDELDYDRASAGEEDA